MYEFYMYDHEEFKDGWDFERYCAELLRNNGYTEVSLTSHNDNGVDIIAFKEGKKYAFQCKYRGSYKDKLSNSTVQEIFTGKTLYGADVGVIISNVDLTRPALRVAEQLGIVVWSEFYIRLLSNN